MSWSEVKKINSDLGAPLNHLIWLNDYKTYGENSYVFQDKRILKELYASPIAANDVQIFIEAANYNSSYMTNEDLIKWAKNRYATKDLPENIILPLTLGNFSSWSDEELSTVLNAHYENVINISDWVSVGDKRKITLSEMKATGVGESHVEQTVEFAIAGFDHDNLTTAINGHDKAAITLTQTGLLAPDGYMNSSGTNVGGWASCARRTWCNDVCYNALPSGIKSIVKEVNKRTSSGNYSSNVSITSDKAFLFSEKEIYGSVGYSFDGEGDQYEYYAITGNRNKSNKQWYLRSPSKSSDYEHFCVVWDNQDKWYSRAQIPYGISIGLCI